MPPVLVLNGPNLNLVGATIQPAHRSVPYSRRRDRRFGRSGV
jgi:hypothetical protein